MAAAVWLAGTPLHPFELYGDVIRAAGFEVTLPGGFDMGRLVMAPDEVGELLAGGGFEDIEVETRRLAFRWALGGDGRPRRGGDALSGLPVDPAAGAPRARCWPTWNEPWPRRRDPTGDFTMSSVLARATA